MIDNWNEGDYFDVSFGINRSRRYHAKMQDFYQHWYDYTNVGNALCGAGAFLALFGGKDSFWAQVLIGAVTLFSTVATVLGPAKKGEDAFRPRPKIHRPCRRFGEARPDACQSALGDLATS